MSMVIISTCTLHQLIQTEREDVPVLLVGGGSVLVDCEIPLKGASKVIMPSNHWVRLTCIEFFLPKIEIGLISREEEYDN